MDNFDILGNVATLDNGASSPVITVNDLGTGTATVSLIIAGANGMTKEGVGTLVLSGDNTYTGDTIVSAGTLQISAHGSVSDTAGYVGFGAGSNATATVDGAGSTWANSESFSVGEHGGTGTLTIQNGGAVSVTDEDEYVYIGNGTGASGTVTVDGDGSTWTSSELSVGFGGATGTLTIQNKGAVNDEYGHIGEGTGSNGTVTVDGVGSTWANSRYLHVGESGTGTLTIQNGGAVSNVIEGVIGYGSTGGIGGVGTVTVDGAGSKWTNSAELYVARSYNTGTMTIQDGGAVSNTEGYIGFGEESNGTVTVDGAGSTWTNSVSLLIGRSSNTGVGGIGTLTVKNGGVVSVNGGAGTVTLATRVVGATGTFGTLNIGAGGTAGTLEAAEVTGGAGTATVNFDHNEEGYTFAPVLSGSLSVEHTGPGTTILNRANTYTGDTTVNAGTLGLDFSAPGAPTTNIINSSSALVLGGGTLYLNGKGVTDPATLNSQTFSKLTLNSGGSDITLSKNDAGNSLLLDIGSITRNVGGTVDFTLPSGDQSSTNGIKTPNGAPSTILTDSGVAYATVGGNDWAAKDLSGWIVVGLSTIGGDNGYTPTTEWTLSGNADVAETVVNTTLSEDTSVTSLRFNQNQGTTITAEQRLIVGGILVTSNVGDFISTIAGGTLQGASTKDLVIIQNNTSKELAISSTIADYDGTGLTKSGDGAVILSGENTYTGTTYVNEGILVAASSSALGDVSGDVVVAYGAELHLQGGIAVGDKALTIDGWGYSDEAAALWSAEGANSWAGDITLVDSGYGAWVGSDAGSSLTLTGDIMGENTGENYLGVWGAGTTIISGNIITTDEYGLDKDDEGTLTLSGDNSYTGDTWLDSGTLNINSATALGTSTLVMGGFFGEITIDNTSDEAITLSTNNHQEWYADFTFTGTNNLNLGTGDVTIFDDVTVTVEAGNLTVGGSIGEYEEGCSLTKAGAGTLTLSGDNTYTGYTWLDEGALNINSATALGESTLIINDNSGDGIAIDNTSGAAITLSNNNSQEWSTDFTFTGTNDLNLGTGSVDMSNQYVVITVKAGNLTVGGIIEDNSSDGWGLTKSGAGTLTLTANSTYFGATTVNGGTLNLDFSADGGWRQDIISSGSSLVLGGGTLLLTGTGTVATLNSQVFADTTVNSGASSIALTFNGNDLLLDLGDEIIRDTTDTMSGVGGTVDFTLPSGDQTDTNGIITTRGNINNILGAWATVGATDYATNVDGNIVSLATILEKDGGYTDITNGNPIISDAASNVRILGDVDKTITLGVETSVIINTLNQSAIEGFNPAMIDLEGGTLSLNGILVGSNAGALTIGDVLGNAGTLTAAVDDDSNSELILINNSTNDLTVNADIANYTDSVPFTHSSSLTKSGTGAVTLNGENEYSGGTTLNEGTLNLGNVIIDESDNRWTRALGSGDLIINGGSIDNTSGGSLALAVNIDQYWNGDFTFEGTNDLNLGNGDVLLGGNRTVTVNGSNLTVGGAIDDESGYSLTKEGNGTLTLLSENTYTGNTVINGGTLVVGVEGEGSITDSAVTVNNTGTLKGSGTTGAVTINSGGTLSPGNSPGTLTSDGDVTYSGGGTYTWEINDVGYMGEDPGWDLHDISGLLTIDASSGNEFTIALTSLTLANESGWVENFDDAENYTWTIARANGGIGGFDSTAFTLDAENFLNDYSGTFSINSVVIPPSEEAGYTALQLIYTGGTSAVDSYWTGNLGNVWSATEGEDPAIITNWATDQGGETDMGAIPDDTTDVKFYATGATNLETTLGANFTINGLTMVGGAVTGDVVIGDGIEEYALTINEGGITIESDAGKLTIQSNVTLGDEQTWTNNSTASLFAVTGDIENGGNDLTIAGDGNTTLSGVLGVGDVKTGGLIKEGAGMLTLSGANTYTGTTTINAGTLLLTENQASPLYNFTGDGVLKLGDAVDLTANITTAPGGQGTLTFEGDGGVTGTLGESDAYLKAINVAQGYDYAVRLDGDAYVNQLNFGAMPEDWIERDGGDTTVYFDGNVTIGQGNSGDGITTGWNEYGVVEFYGNATINGDIGASEEALWQVWLDGEGTKLTLNGNVYQNEVPDPDPSAWARTTIYFNNDDQVIEVANGRTIGADIAEYLDGGSLDNSTLTFLGSATVTGDIGYDSWVSEEDGEGSIAPLDVVNFSGSDETTVTLSGDVYASELNFTNDGFVTLTAGHDINADVKTSTHGTGTLTLEGDNVVNGDIGSGNALNVVNIGSGTVAVNGDLYANEVYVGAGTLEMNGDLMSSVGTVNFSGALDGTLELAGGHTIETDVSTATAGTGTLNFLGDGEVTGVIGAGNALKAITLRGGAGTVVILDRDVYAITMSVGAGTLNLNGSFYGDSPKTLKFTGDGEVVLADNEWIYHSVTTDNNGTGTLTFEGDGVVTGQIGTAVAGENPAAYLKAINVTNGDYSVYLGTDRDGGPVYDTFVNQLNFKSIPVGAGEGADTEVTFYRDAYIGNGGITTEWADHGTVNFTHNADVTGQVGAQSSYLGTINVAQGVSYIEGVEKFGFTANLNSDVYTNYLNFGPNPGGDATDSTVNFNGNANIYRDITTQWDGYGIVNFNGNATINGKIGEAYGEETGMGELWKVYFNSGMAVVNNAIHAAEVHVTGNTTLGLSSNFQSNGGLIDGNLTLGNPELATDTSMLDVGSNTLSITDSGEEGPGDYYQVAGTTLKLNINSAITSGGVVVGGSTDVEEGANVHVTVPTGISIANGTAFTIITVNDAEGVVNGIETPTVTSNTRRYAFTASVDGTTGDLLITSSEGSYVAPTGATGNESAVANVLNGIPNPTGDMNTVLDQLGTLSDSEYDKALDTMHPDVSSGVADGSRSLTSQGFTTVSNRLGGARNGGASVSGISSGDRLDGVGVWMQALGSNIRQGERKGVEGYNGNLFGTTIGADKVIDKHFRAGFAGSYGWARVKSKTAGSPSDDINSFQGTIYGSFDSLDLNKARQGGKKSYEAVRSQVEKSWYVDGMFAFTQNNYDSRREIWVTPANKRVAKAEHYGQQYSTNFEAGYKFVFEKTKNLEVTPFVSLGYSYLFLNKYKESGANALNLSVDGQGFNQLEQSLGTKLAYPLVNKKMGTFIPSAKAAWLYDYISDTFETTASFAGGGASFNTQGAKPARNGMLFGAELAFLNKGNVTLTGNWDIELKDQYMSNTYYGTARYDF